MAQLYAFEQLIINTEEQIDQSFLQIEQVEESKEEHDGDTNDKVKTEIMRLTNVSSTTSQLILEALLAAQEKDNAEQACAYELNEADVIKEEDYEESVGEMSFRNGGTQRKSVRASLDLERKIENNEANQ